MSRRGWSSIFTGQVRQLKKLEGYEAADLLAEEENLRFGPDHIDILDSIGAMPFDQVCAIVLSGRLGIW